jgi:hypothetical protein
MMDTMVNSNSQFKDWIIMDCYNGNDVGGGVALGINRQSLGAYIMRSAAARTSWAESAELLGTHNYSSYAAKKTEAIKSISRSGTTFTATRCDGTTFTFTQQDNDHYAWSDITGKPSEYTPSADSSYYHRRDAWWNMSDTSKNPDDLHGGTVFAYTQSHNTPTTGTLVSFDCITRNTYGLQMQGGYGENSLYYRNRNGDQSTWLAWKRLTTANETVKSISRSGTTFTATRCDGTTFTFDLPQWGQAGESTSAISYPATAVELLIYVAWQNNLGYAWDFYVLADANNVDFRRGSGNQYCVINVNASTHKVTKSSVIYNGTDYTSAAMMRVYYR